MNARHWNDQRWPFLSFLIGCLTFSFCDPSLMFLLSILLPLSQNSCSFFSSFGLFLEFRISSTFFIPSHNSCCFDINNLLNWKIRFLFGLKNQLDKCTVQIFKNLEGDLLSKLKQWGLNQVLMEIIIFSSFLSLQLLSHSLNLRKKQLAVTFIRLKLLYGVVLR